MRGFVPTQSHIRRESVAGEWASRRARQGSITGHAPFVTLLQARHQRSTRAPSGPEVNTSFAAAGPA